MVEDSFSKFIGKYPYFLNKNPGSVFYRTSKVNNDAIQRLYNDLFKVYEGGHLSKRVLVWKEQTKPYEYEIHFKALYPFIKDVTIYKNGSPIYFKEYKRYEEIDEFIYIYSCTYFLNYNIKLTPYQCTECGTIYFDNNILENCDECGNSRYIKLTPYQCEVCNEIYFSNEKIKDCSKNNHQNALKEMMIYECGKCGEIYFTDTEEENCPNCNANLKPININNVPIEDLTSNENIYLEDNRNIGLDEELNSSYIKYYFEAEGTYENPIDISIRNTEGNIIERLILNQSNDWKCESRELEKGAEDFIINYNPNININYYTEEIYTYNDIKNIDDKLSENSEVSKFSIPIIPEDNFVIKINTFEEYSIEKGFPENDEITEDYAGNVIPNIFDHDRSLDELGALNDIPRKNYNFIDDPLLYPYTEPPYNNRLSEDDYHYMCRMLKYNVLLWASIKPEVLYDIDKKYLESIGITEDDFNLYKSNPRLFKQKYNPVSLELWKIYGIESNLINRERYLIKVFDENQHPFNEETELVKCWTPLLWEHKDKFCDGSYGYGEYFFVSANNTNPVVNEPITVSFHLKNSLGEDIEEEFFVKAYKIDDDGNQISITDKIYNDNIIDDKIYSDNIKISHTCFNIPKGKDYNYENFNIEDYITVLRFYAFKLNGEPINVDSKGNIIPVDIIIIVRDYYNSDIHVDNVANRISGGIDENYVPDGSLKYPYLTLEDAINNVTGNNNIIGVNIRDLNNTKYILSDYPLIISNNVKIVGNVYYPLSETGEYIHLDDDESKPLLGYVPRIVNRMDDNNFFKIVGGKNYTLTLSNLFLIKGQMSSFIDISLWNNHNDDLSDYEGVIIHGGAVLIDIEMNEKEYFPFDFIHLKVKLMKKGNNQILPSNMVRVYYDGKLVGKGLTDNDGICEFIVNINHLDKGTFYLNIRNVSNQFFESNVTKTISVNKDYSEILIIDSDKNIVYKGDDVEFIPSNEYDEEVYIYSPDESIEPILWDFNDSGNYVLNNVPHGRFIYYITDDNSFNGEVLDEWLIETHYDISMLLDYLSSLSDWDGTIVKNLQFKNGILSYDTFEINSESTLEDFNNGLITAEINNNNLVVKSFYKNITEENKLIFSYSEYIYLKDLIYAVDFDEDTGILKVKRIGDFIS